MPAAPVRVVFLGTGGALNHERYQASVLVEHGATRILLDTGGGLGLVRRLLACGIEPASIGHVFLSHRHLDHAGGLEPFLLWVGIRSRLAGEQPAPLRLYASRETTQAVRTTLAAADAAGQEKYGDSLAWVPLADGESAHLGDGQRLTIVPVEHLPDGGGASGCVLELAGRRVVYSGDTLPCDSLAEAARGADLLIHEVGGPHADAHEVHRPRHTTAHEAGLIAAGARAAALALFHVPPAGYVLPDALLAEAHTAAPAVECFVAEDRLVRLVG